VKFFLEPSFSWYGIKRHYLWCRLRHIWHSSFFDNVITYHVKMCFLDRGTLIKKLLLHYTVILIYTHIYSYILTYIERQLTQDLLEILLLETSHKKNHTKIAQKRDCNKKKLFRFAIQFLLHEIRNILYKYLISEYLYFQAIHKILLRGLISPISIYSEITFHDLF